MTTLLSPDCDLLTFPFTAATDFTDLTDCCDRFAKTLMECHDDVYKMALLGRLSACLSLLGPTLHDPIPPHLIARFTVETLPVADADVVPAVATARNGKNVARVVV